MYHQFPVGLKGLLGLSAGGLGTSGVGRMVGDSENGSFELGVGPFKFHHSSLLTCMH